VASSLKVVPWDYDFTAPSEEPYDGLFVIQWARRPDHGADDDLTASLAQWKSVIAQSSVSVWATSCSRLPAGARHE